MRLTQWLALAWLFVCLVVLTWGWNALMHVLGRHRSTISESMWALQREHPWAACTLLAVLLLYGLWTISHWALGWW